MTKRRKQIPLGPAARTKDAAPQRGDGRMDRKIKLTFLEKTIHALMLDPLCAAVCTPAEIKSMALEMFAAEKSFLPGYK